MNIRLWLRRLLVLSLSLVGGVGVADAQKTQKPEIKTGRSPFGVVNIAMGGDGILYEGGDLLYQRLLTARERLNQTFALLEAGHEVESLCEARACGSEKTSALCGTLNRLDDNAKKACRRFVLGHLGELKAVNREPVAPLSVSGVPLTVNGPNGSVVAVDAMTKSGRTGAILFYQGKVAATADRDLLALLAHELGHKVANTGEPFIEDGSKVPGFLSGRAFLDTVGAALAIYATRFGMPTQSPPAIPGGVAREEACRVAAEPRARFLLGLAADAEGRIPEAAVLAGWMTRLEALAKAGDESARVAFIQGVLTGERARVETINHLFVRFLYRPASAEERELMMARLKDGIPFDTLAASILGDVEYLGSHGIKGRDQFVNAIFLELLGRAPTAAETRGLSEKLKLADGASLVQWLFRQGDAAWEHLVEVWYQELLNRAPTPTEKQTHVAKLRAGASWENVRAYLFAEPEYSMLQTVRWQPCSVARK